MLISFKFSLLSFPLFFSFVNILSCGDLILSIFIFGVFINEFEFKDKISFPLKSNILFALFDLFISLLFSFFWFLLIFKLCRVLKLFILLKVLVLDILLKLTFSKIF